MLPRSLTILTTALCAGLPVGAPQANADPNKWRPVSYSDLQLPGEGALPYASLWSDQLQHNNRAYEARGDRRFAAANAPAAASYIVIRSSARVVVLSVLHTLTSCTTLRTDRIANTALKKCPMRLAVYEQGASMVANAGQGCFIEYGRSAAGQPDLVRNITMGAYEMETRTIRAGTIFAGRRAEECQFRVPVPQ